VAVETHLMYDGKKYEVLGHVEHGNGSLSVDLKPVPELPPQPPKGTTLFDRYDVPWHRGEDGMWCPPGGPRFTRTWGSLLRYSPLYPAVIVPEGKSAVLFDGEFSDLPTHDYYMVEAVFRKGHRYVRGYSEMEAPVHGHFEQVTDA
jgi:hypothetical protein